MDKLTAIRIKYNDGTYSDQIPVSVQAGNVIWDSTHSLTDILGNVDFSNKGNIQQQINRLFVEKFDLDQLTNYVDTQLSEDVTNWLEENITETGSAIMVDASLSIQGAAADAKATRDVVNQLNEHLTSLEENIRIVGDIEYISSFSQGQLNPSSGGASYSDKWCRTSQYTFLESGEYLITPKEGYAIVLNEYNRASIGGTFSRCIINNGTGEIEIAVSKDLYYRFAVRTTEYDVITPNDLPEDVISVCVLKYTDNSLSVLGKAADAKETGDRINALDEFYSNLLQSSFNESELEPGKFTPSTASIGSSSAFVSTSIGGEQIEVLGVRSKASISNGYVDNVSRIVSHGTIYMYAVGVDNETGTVLGYYYDGEWRISVKPIYVTQDLDIKTLKANIPNLRVKLCFVDISVGEQIDASDVVEYIDVYYAAGRIKTNSVDNKLTEIDKILGVLPNYYNTNDYFDNKINAIRQNMALVGRRGFTFVFFTDLHWDRRNNQKSPILIKSILSNTNVNNVICGGDLINQGTKEYAEDTLSDCINAFKAYGITFPVCYGNHDSNWNPYLDQREHPERKLSEKEVWAYIEAQYDKHTPIYYADGFNFYIDYPDTNTRVIFIDTGDTRELDGVSGIFWRNYEVFSDLLMASENKNIIVVTHAVAIDSIGNRLCRISNSYNNRTVFDTSYLSYDFTSAQGHVYLVIGGHGHNDVITTPTDGGVSWVMTDTDSTLTNSENDTTAGTVNEQAIDVVTVDYDTGGVYFVRIGRGTDRTIPPNIINN